MVQRYSTLQSIPCASLVAALSCLVCSASGLPPVSVLSAKYRNWTYYNGSFDGFVVPPTAGDFSGQTLTDTAIVFEKTPEDTLPGRFRMSYLFYNGTDGGYGYEAAIATSDDLLNWSFGQGGDNGSFRHAFCEFTHVEG